MAGAVTASAAGGGAVPHAGHDLGARGLGRARPFGANWKGETWTYLLWLAVFHVLNHQSYHRGQVTMQLRLLGFEPPQVDFLVAHDMGFRL